MATVDLAEIQAWGQAANSHSYRTFGARLNDIISVADYLRPGGASPTLASVPRYAGADGLENLRLDYGIPDDHPIFGTAAPFGRATLSLNAAILTGLFYKYPGALMLLKSGTYDFGDTPVVYVPRRSGIGQGFDHGEPGPWLVGEHILTTVLDFKGVTNRWGATWQKQFACFEVRGNPSGASRDRLASNLHLESFRLVGPRKNANDGDWISGIRLEIESGVVRNLRIQGCPDIGLYLVRRRFDLSGMDDRMSFTRVEHVMINSCNRIGLCIGARGRFLPAAAGEYVGLESGTGSWGFEADHIVTERCDVQNIRDLGAQVWAEAWTDQASLFQGRKVGLRVVGFRNGLPSFNVLQGSRIERQVPQASFSLWGNAALFCIGCNIVAGGYLGSLNTTVTTTANLASVAIAGLASGINLFPHGRRPCLLHARCRGCGGRE